MTSSEELSLLENYKRDFELKTGKGLRVTVVNRSENLAFFTYDIKFYTALYLILQLTNWKYEDIVGESRKRELVSQREFVNYIMYHNGITILKLGFYMNRDHTTILNSLRTFEHSLETDDYTKKLFKEIVENLKEHYSHTQELSKVEFLEKIKIDV